MGVQSKRLSFIIAGAFAFASRYLTDNEAEKLLEVLEMTDLAALLMERGWNQGKQEGLMEGILTIAKRMLKNGLPAKTILENTGLDETDLVRLRAEMGRD